MYGNNIPKTLGSRFSPIDGLLKDHFMNFSLNGFHTQATYGFYTVIHIYAFILNVEIHIYTCVHIIIHTYVHTQHIFMYITSVMGNTYTFYNENTHTITIPALRLDTLKEKAYICSYIHMFVLYNERPLYIYRTYMFMKISNLNNKY